MKSPALLGLRLLAVALFAFATWVALRFMNQPLMEDLEFRQTQTALTSYWLLQKGFSLAYETPVVGAPWAVPFEFPIYQWLAAQTSRIGIGLDGAGRLVSFVLLAACLWPARRIARALELRAEVFPIFACLLFSSPLYLFWGRTFLIETAALFFALAFVAFAIPLQRNPRNFLHASVAGVFLTLALLQKSTTALPVLAVLAVCWVIARFDGWRRGKIDLRELAAFTVAYVMPFAISCAWTRYTDLLRTAEPRGPWATSAASLDWFFGPLRCHFAPGIWLEVLGKRMLLENCGFALGAVVLIAALVAPKERRAKQILVATLTLALLPIFVFTNIHFHHDYYQTSCLLFLLGAIAIALAHSAAAFSKTAALPLAITVLIVGANLYHFQKKRWAMLHQSFTPATNTTLALGELLRTSTPVDSAFVAFGYDWSSALAYYSQRRSFTAPPFFREYQRVWTEPERYLGGKPLSAIVVCPSEAGLFDVNARAKADPSFRVVDVFDCKVLLRDR